MMEGSILESFETGEVKISSFIFCLWLLEKKKRPLKIARRFRRVLRTGHVHEPANSVIRFEIVMRRKVFTL